jgi:hypothetical protein
MLGKRADPKANRSHAFELPGEMPAYDSNEPGRKTALRSHDPFRRPPEGANMLGRQHVLGEVEVVDAQRVSRRCDRLVERVWQGGQNRLLLAERRLRRGDIAEVRHMHGEGRAGDRARVESRYLESRIDEELCGEMANPPQS